MLSGNALFYIPPNLMIPSTEERTYKRVFTMVQDSSYTAAVPTHKLRADCVPQVSVQLVSDKEKAAPHLSILME